MLAVEEVADRRFGPELHRSRPLAVDARAVLMHLQRRLDERGATEQRPLSRHHVAVVV